MIMSCNQEHFIKEEQVLRDTYLSRLPENIYYLIYRGGYENVEYNENMNRLHLNCKHDINNTFKKTYEALYWVIGKYGNDYEYIFRTNTSTYINIDLLKYFTITPNGINKVDKYAIIIATPGEIKKFASGNGSAKKDVMIKLFESIFPNLYLIPKIDDIADSYWMCEYVKSITSK